MEVKLTGGGGEREGGVSSLSLYSALSFSKPLPSYSYNPYPITTVTIFFLLLTPHKIRTYPFTQII